MKNKKVLGKIEVLFHEAGDPTIEMVGDIDAQHILQTIVAIRLHYWTTYLTERRDREVKSAELKKVTEEKERKDLEEANSQEVTVNKEFDNERVR
jgi:hypothetical protein